MSYHFSNSIREDLGVKILLHSQCRLLETGAAYLGLGTRVEDRGNGTRDWGLGLGTGDRVVETRDYRLMTREEGLVLRTGYYILGTGD